jgi:hypothetical protein
MVPGRRSWKAPSRARGLDPDLLATRPALFPEESGERVRVDGPPFVGGNVAETELGEDLEDTRVTSLTEDEIRSIFGPRVDADESGPWSSVDTGPWPPRAKDPTATDEGRSPALLRRPALTSREILEETAHATGATRDAVLLVLAGTCLGLVLALAVLLIARA